MQSYRFGLTTTPRAVPPALAARVTVGQALAQLGALLGLVDGALVCAMLPLVRPARELAFVGALEHRDGRVTSIAATRTRIDGEPVREFGYEFVDGAGRQHEGASFATRGPSRGQAVSIEFPAGHPERSRIVGMSGATIPPFMLLPMSAIGVVGFVLFGVAVRRGRRAVRLLRIGEPATGRLLARTPTNTTINGRRVWALRFGFTARDGRAYETLAKSHHPRRLMDEADEPLVYDPHDPSSAAMMDALPGKPRIGADGQLREGRPAGRVVILPTLAVLAWAAALVLAIVLR